MILSQPEPGAFRCRIPLYFINCPLSERLELAEDVVLAPLTAIEAERVHAALVLEHLIYPRMRLECGVPNRGQAAEMAYDEGAATIYRTLALLALATHALPEWPEPVVDQYSSARQRWEWQSNVGRAWLEYPPPKHSGGQRPHLFALGAPPDIRGLLPISGGESYAVDSAGLDRLKALMDNFPSPTRERQLHLSLTYLYESLLMLATNPVMAYLHASIAFEALLGDGLPELSYRLALRGAHLAAHEDSEREILFNQLRIAYSTRSKLVHEGKLPGIDALMNLTRFLLRGIPLFARLVNLVTGRQSALEALDRSARSSVPEVAELQQSGWWSSDT